MPWRDYRCSIAVVSPHTAMQGAKVLVFLAACVALAAAQPTDKNVKLLVQVFYESLCPYSIEFITDQLYLAYSTIGPGWLDVQLVPFGKAEAFSSGDDYAFRCQHGSSECYGNKVQACALARLAGMNPFQVSYAICAMSSNDTSNPSDECAESVMLDPDDLKTCASGEEGDLLLYSFGQITTPLIYESGVPLVLFDKETTYEDQDIIQNDLVDFICLKFYVLGQGMPPACNSV